MAKFEVFIGGRDYNSQTLTVEALNHRAARQIAEYQAPGATIFGLQKIGNNPPSSRPVVTSSPSRRSSSNDNNSAPVTPEPTRYREPVMSNSTPSIPTYGDDNDFDLDETLDGLKFTAVCFKWIILLMAIEFWGAWFVGKRVWRFGSERNNKVKAVSFTLLSAFITFYAIHIPKAMIWNECEFQVTHLECKSPDAAAWYFIKK